MARLKLLLAGVLLLFSPAAHASPLAQWRSHIEEASRRFNIPASWIERVMLAESGARTHMCGLPVRSRAGAIGLMQIMPATWSEIRGQLGLGHDPDAPRDNILAGTYYLRIMYDRFGYPGLFGAYNAGPGRYAAYLAGKARLPAETRAYLRRTTKDDPQKADRASAFSSLAPMLELAGENKVALARDLFFIHRDAAEDSLREHPAGAQDAEPPADAPVAAARADEAQRS